MKHPNLNKMVHDWICNKMSSNIVEGITVISTVHVRQQGYDNGSDDGEMDGKSLGGTDGMTCGTADGSRIEIGLTALTSSSENIR